MAYNELKRLFKIKVKKDLLLILIEVILLIGITLSSVLIGIYEQRQSSYSLEFNERLTMNIYRSQRKAQHSFEVLYWNMLSNGLLNVSMGFPGIEGVKTLKGLNMKLIDIVNISIENLNEENDKIRIGNERLNYLIDHHPTCMNIADCNKVISYLWKIQLIFIIASLIIYLKIIHFMIKKKDDSDNQSKQS